jgi:hypothetical protein
MNKSKTLPISVFVHTRKVSSHIAGMRMWVNHRYLDAVMNAMLGGDLSLEPEYWRAHTRATALEGELYVITNGEHDRIVSMASLFGPGRAVFGR